MRCGLLCAIAAMLFPCGPVDADDATAASRQSYLQSQQRTGLLIPLYHYPENIHTNAVFNRLIELKLKYPVVPICAIVNPASGPGEGAIDRNYTKAIDRLTGAGIHVVGYVSTNYAKIPGVKVGEEISAWKSRYPRVQGIFLDEMANENSEKMVEHYVRLTRHAHELGFWPVIANPGTATPEVYFKGAAADVIVIHEAATYPTETSLRGDYFGGYADYPVFGRGALVYGQKDFNAVQFRVIKRHTRWVYVTEDTGDNPWDTLSAHMDAMLTSLRDE